MTVGFHAMGGSYTVVENLCNKLSKKGISVTIGALSFKNVPPKRSFSYTVIPIGDVLRLTKLLNSFDIVHNHHPITNYLDLISRVPFIYHYHGVPSIGRSNFFRFSMLSSVKITRHRFAALIANSETSRAEIKKLVDPKKIHVICSGVDTNLFKPDVPELFRKGSPQCLFVGNLFDYKKVDELIIALKILKAEYPKIHLLVVGDGEANQKLKRLVNRLNLQNNVTFTGAILHDNLCSYYASCDVYVTASRCETSSLPLLEAWACGKPAVASSIPAHEELLSASRAGAIYKVGDIHDLCSKIASVFKLKEEFRCSAIQFAKKRDWSNVADQTIEVYNKILSD